MDLSLLWRWARTKQNLKDWLTQEWKLQSFVFQKVPIQQLLLANQLGEFEYNFRCRKWFFGRLPRKIKIFESMAFGHLTELLRSILKSYVFLKSGRIFLFPMTMAFCLLTYSVKCFIHSAASRSLGSIFLGTTHNDMFTSKY